MRNCFLALTIGYAALGCGHAGSEPAARYRFRPIDVEPVNGCSEQSPRFLPSVRASDTESGPTGKYDTERFNAWLARRVPGGWSFGPMVDSIRHTTRLWMRDSSQARAALAALDTLSPSSPLFAKTYPDSIVVGQTRWDYAELYDWMHYLNSGIGEARGVRVTGWAIEALSSRLMFGVETNEMVPEMVAWLVSKRIPCRLVVIRVMGRIYLHGQPSG